MMWRVPRMWDGGDVWIIGGGPSIPKQFGVPDDVIQKVIAGASPKIYSSYMSALHDKHVIGINVAYLLGDWIDMVFFGDGGFFMKHSVGLSKFPGLKVSCHPKAEKVKWVKFVGRDGSHSRGISNSPSRVSWNGNSGAAAINVTAHAGAKRIILLGFDMRLSDTNYQHWHDLYGRHKAGYKNKKGKINLPFTRHLRGFPQIASDAKKLGVEIINASPTSMINCFPKYSVNELLYDNS